MLTYLILTKHCKETTTVFSTFMLHGGVNYLAQFHRAVTDRAELEPRQSARAWLLNQYTILPLRVLPWSGDR